MQLRHAVNSQVTMLDGAPVRPLPSLTGRLGPSSNPRRVFDSTSLVPFCFPPWIPSSRLAFTALDSLVPFPALDSLVPFSAFPVLGPSSRFPALQLDPPCRSSS